MRNATYDKKLIVRKTFSELRVCHPSYYKGAMLPLLQDIDKYFLNNTMLKEGDTTTVIKVEVDGRPLVIKRYNIKGFWHGVKRAFRRSRADRCWHTANTLVTLGIATPNPIAFLEKRFGRLRRQAYYVCEYIEATDALHYFKNAINPQEECQSIADNIVAVLQQLLTSKISHGDLKATNILLHHNQPVLIDLDAMRIHRTRWSFLRARRRDVARFMKNWRDMPEVKNLFTHLRIF